MKLALYPLILISLSGCASLKTTFFEKVHVGETREQVQEAFGQPDSFGPSESIIGGIKWVYVKGPDICGVVFVDNKVNETGCVPNPNYVSTRHRLGSAFKALGDGMNSSSAASLSCTSDSYGGSTIYTSCH